MDTTSNSPAAPYERGAALTMRTYSQLGMLSVQFLLGMAVNLLGTPSETHDGTRVATVTCLVLHSIISVGQIVVAALSVRLARQAGPNLARLAAAGAVVIVLTVGTGVGAAVTDNAWWSYLMGVGFLVAFLIYGRMALTQRAGR